MPAPIKPTSNLHTVFVYGQPLGVECRGCGHRGLAFEDRVEDLRGNMRELRRLGFVCQACGGRDWTGWLLFDDADRQAFIGAGGGRPSF